VLEGVLAEQESQRRLVQGDDADDRLGGLGRVARLLAVDCDPVAVERLLRP
jgi:hypothetical protein